MKSMNKYIIRTDTHEFLRRLNGESPVWTEDFSKAKFYPTVNEADDDYETLKGQGFSIDIKG